MTFPLLSDMAFSICVCSPLLPLMNRCSPLFIYVSPDQGVSFAYVIVWFGCRCTSTSSCKDVTTLLSSIFLFFSFPVVIWLSIALSELSFEFKSLRKAWRATSDEVRSIPTCTGHSIKLGEHAHKVVHTTPGFVLIG